MARKTPSVRGNALVCHEGQQERTITIGTPLWFAWLDQATVFHFSSPLGTFTACRERFQRGGWYWRAHRKRSGKVHRVYLGKAEALTPERLNEVAAALAASADQDQTPPSRSPNDQCRLESKPPARDLPLPLSMVLAPQSADGPGEPLLATKLLLPPAGAGLVPRPRLAARLNDVLQYKLTLISAPAGFGKTTLLSQWSSHAACPVAWVSLDAEDDDLARFWAYFVAALQAVYPGLAAPVLSLMSSAAGLRVESWLTVLINALAGAPEDFVVILDDYHTIESQVVHRGLDYLLDHLPPRVHLVIATRIDPPLALARLRGKGQMSELRAADLSFNQEEAAAFLRQVLGEALSTEEVAALSERTEGWAVGLQVAALSLRGLEDKGAFVKGFAGEHHHIIDYLVEEVLHRQSEAIQTFLLQTSILDRLSAPLCEAVTGQPAGQAMLETLERANLFTVPLDAEQHWYRYHRLFADFLRARLHATHAEQLPDLHRRASIWFAAHDLPEEAVGHALAAKEFNHAANLIEQRGAVLRKRGEVATILGWLRALPEEIVHGRPALCLLHAWLLASTSELDASEARLRHAEAGFAAPASAAASAPSGPEAGDRERLENEVRALRAQIAVYRGDWRLAIRLGRQALGHASGLERDLGARIRINLGSAYWWSGDVVRAGEAFVQASSTVHATGEIPGAISSLCSLASVQRVRGHLRQAATTYGQALELVAEQNIKGFLYSSWPYLGLGRLRYEWNDLIGALRYADESIQLTRDAGVALLLLAGYTLLEKVRQAQGDLEGALEMNQQAQQLAHLHGNRREFPLLKAYQARLWLAQGNLEAALRWARESGLSADDRPSYEHETEHMALAQVLISQGSAAAALALLERLRQAAEAGDRVGSLIKILVLQALAWHARGFRAEALVPLERALSLAQPEGYVRTFLDRGASVAVLLCELLEHGRQHRLMTVQGALLDYARSLLSAFKTEIPGLQPATSPQAIDQPLISSLSEREREVLRLIAAGSSAPEIARDLVVSLNTVKTHLKHIYGKLDVHSGKEAVAKAQHLTLL